MIRYYEYKSAGKLPKVISDCDCKTCTEKLEGERNCGGFGNDKYVQKIGAMEYYQCPLSLITTDAWSVINLILVQEETGIPIAGTCLLDQTPEMFEFREAILAEKADCFKELNKTTNPKEKEMDMYRQVPKGEIRTPGKDAPIRKFTVPTRPQKSGKK